MNFIIFVSGYDDNSGGTVVMHQLCHRLNELGEKAFIWPTSKPFLDPKHPFKTAYLVLRYHFRHLRRKLRKNPSLITPIASYADLKEAIVIYPEVIRGNPLQAQNVVRWLLYTLGGETKKSLNFGENDLFFYYDKAFDNPMLNPYPDNHLHIISSRTTTYQYLNTQKREGTCTILRKGRGRKIVHDLKNSVVIDGLSHQATANIFNRVEFCISYDNYTMYTTYAAMCGCIPIVIPEEGVTKEQWQPEEASRYGIAYGFGDTDYAIQTRPLLLESLQKKEYDSRQSVVHFVEKCNAYFSSPSS